MKEQEVPRVNHLKTVKEVEGWRRQGEAYWTLVSHLGYFVPENGQISPEPSEEFNFSLPGGSKLAPAVLTSILALSCARPDQPAEVRPSGGVATQITETPRPVQPKPTEIPRREEREVGSPIVLLPIKIEEGKTPEFTVPPGQRKASPETGWKYVYVEFAAENRSNSTSLVRLTFVEIDKSVLLTKEGFEYKLSMPGQLATQFSFNGPIFHSFPPGFRALGVYNLSFVSGVRPSPDDKGVYTNKMIFRVGEQTTPYRLRISTADVPPGLYSRARDYSLFPPPQPFPEIDLTKGAIPLDTLKFPTSRPDSEFKTLGTTVNIPGKGSVTVEDVEDRIYQGATPYGKMYVHSAKTRIRIRFHNESKGYGQVFNLTVKLFGEDGILYTTLSDSAIEKFPRQPIYWDGHPVTSGEVPPGTDKIAFAEIVTSSTLKSGKLMVSGDINEIFNVQLPEPKLPPGVQGIAKP